MFRNRSYIQAVYRSGSFSAAAKELFISQPCLSAMVKKTEDQLGVPIFDRNTKPLSLTEYGVRYMEYLEKTQALEREFEQYLVDVRGLRTGRLSIGANNVLSSQVLPLLIQHFKRSYPGVEVQMVEGNIAYLTDALIRGQLDLVLDNCAMDTDVCTQQQLGAEQLLLAVPKSIHSAEAFSAYCLTHDDILAGNHLKETAPTISVEAFSQLPFIALRPGNDTRFRMDEILKQAGTRADIQLEVDQLATAYNIACNGLGLTLVSDTLLYMMPSHPNICYYKLRSAATTRAIYMYHKRTRYITLAMQKFMDTALDALSEGVANLN